MLSTFREQILETASRARFNHLEIPHEQKGPKGEALYTDYFFTPEKKEKCLVHLSGLHGVEGYLGSLIQQEILKQNLEDLPIQLVFVHTVNPYGMASFLRTNAENVDLNRNSLKEYQVPNPHFRSFYPFLKTGQPLDFLKALPTIAKIGRDQTAVSVACGQTEFPDSLFFCGHERQAELISLKKNLEFLISSTTQVFSWDLHTGLGKMGNESLIFQSLNPSTETKLQTAFNTKLTLPGRDPGFYLAHGSLALLFQEIWPSSSQHCVQEFGTQPFYKVLRALIHKNPEQMLEAFFPKNPQWRKRCIDLGLLRFNQLVQYLS